MAYSDEFLIFLLFSVLPKFLHGWFFLEVFVSISLCNANLVCFWADSTNGKRMDLKSSLTTSISKMTNILFLLLFMILGKVLKVRNCALHQLEALSGMGIIFVHKR